MHVSLRYAMEFADERQGFIVLVCRIQTPIESRHFDNWQEAHNWAQAIAALNTCAFHDSHQIVQ